MEPAGSQRDSRIQAITPKALGIPGDIRKTSRPEIAKRLGLRRGDIDVIIGGPPCQGFSSIRPNRSANFDDPRNNLFEEFAAHVGYWRPLAFVFENVVGLATHNNGLDLEAVEDTFGRLNYQTDWKILNAAHFGVPQKRERLILIGTQPGIQFRWPKPTHAGRFRTIGFKDSSRMLIPSEPTLLDQGAAPLPPALTVADAIDDLPPVESGETATQYVAPARTVYQKERRVDAFELTWHASTRHTEKMMEIIRHAGPNISYIPTHLITSGFSSCYSRLEADEPSPTITVNFVHPASNKCIHPTQHRALTPREGARLQSFDDSFLFAPNTRNQVAKQIGNAVPPLLGRVIGEALAVALNV
ncbi:DNA cytosine methyltransferase [Micromonospora sp. NBS 11-29]|uniref:DNA cytosine methyltransferase n=1 Tax=Micromonospora sp. NBS 11-29 TaxID=1960879 RepID=UPI001C39545C|nr:DNA cytosine methyltransferase [Micromonospora sp. NBS 11-29]